MGTERVRNGPLAAVMVGVVMRVAVAGVMRGTGRGEIGFFSAFVRAPTIGPEAGTALGLA